MDTQRKLKAVGYTFDAPVNALAFAEDGSAYAFGLGNGRVHIVRGEERKTIEAHSGAVPTVCGYGDGFLTLSDDGTLKHIAADGSLKDIAKFKGVWTERMAVHKNGSFAVAVGRDVHLWTKMDAEPRILSPHNGTVNDVYFAPDGRGLAAAHRDGVTLWAWPHFEPQPMVLPWKGAHLSVTVSADKRWIVSAMQEGALHMWNVALKRDYQMRGYFGKPLSMAWSPDKKWLATSGAETVIVWPFDKAGPEGREPLQLGWSNSTLVTHVAAHPEAPVLAAGFEDGAVVMIDLIDKKAFSATAPSGHAVTALAFAPAGDSLIAGTANGGGLHMSFME
ncbi:MAG: WD40 repeat domain-containing protein [Alphaproteobacteria bacterium]|nr:WD40 repeat domain-containing protein [Alphaproteobacteria bacterium]